VIWSLFIPFDVQYSITTGRGKIYQGYEAYSFFFLSKLIVRFAFGIVYSTLAMIRLCRYFKIINRENVHIHKPARWLAVLMGLTVSILLVSVFSIFMSRDSIISSMWSVITVSILVAQHIVLVYNTIRRHFLAYVEEDEMEKISLYPKVKLLKLSKKVIRENTKKTHQKTLNKANFENYLDKYKPYTDPSFKITDLVKPLNANRTYISEFVNTTYGMNFNRYINLCRLKELERLKKHPSTKKTDMPELLSQAGFGSYRSYIRIRKITEERDKQE